MPIVEVPGMGDVEFPDDMSDDQIAAAIKKNLAPSAEPSFLQGTKRAAGLTGRAIYEGVASLPLMAMDMGVAMRNVGGDIAEKLGVADNVYGLNRKIAGNNQFMQALLPQGPGYNELPSDLHREALTGVGVPQAESGLEKASTLAMSVATGARMPFPSQIPGAAPKGFVPPKDVMRQATLQAARKQGLVVPPATTNPSVTNKILESIGGKVATQQDAAMKNQKVFDSLVKRDLGLDDAAIMSEDVLPALRTKAAEAYKPLRTLGTIRADTRYADELKQLASKYEKVGKDFPKLANDEILEAIDAVSAKSFNSDSAVDAIAILREKSSTAYAQGNKPLGKAYRSISDAMENAIERSLERRGKDGAKVLTDFRAARKLMAKAFTAEKALNPQVGSFNASKLATELAKGKPMSGDMRKVAEFARAFPGASKLMLDSGSVRNTDVIMGAGTAALSKEPNFLLYPFARQAVRAGLLSPAGQKLATPGVMQLPPELFYGSTPLFQQRGLFE